MIAAARPPRRTSSSWSCPTGYDTVVGERGLTLSGGQRQRVALARAIITDPRVLILDDATSSIDSQTEEEIHATLRSLMAGRTTLLVAHRRSTLRLADRIVVVDHGRVADSGTHEELMARSRCTARCWPARATTSKASRSRRTRRTRRPRRPARGRRWWTTCRWPRRRWPGRRASARAAAARRRAA